MQSAKATGLGSPRRSLHEQIAYDIGAQIVRGKFQESELLPTELVLAERYNVSRTAVREAFRILAAKGMTYSRPKIGTRVRMRGDWNMLDPEVLAWHIDGHTDPCFLNSVYEARLLIEPEVVFLAAQRRSDRQMRAMLDTVQSIQRASTSLDGEASLSSLMLEAAGNPLFRPMATLAEIIASFLKAAIRRRDLSEQLGVNGLRPGSLEAVGEILAAVQLQDAERARRVMSAMLAHARTEVLDAVQQSVNLAGTARS